MERNLIDYLPTAIAEYLEIQAIMEAEQKLFSLSWEKAYQVMSDQFISEATESGIMRLEQILRIQPKATDTLEERRFRVSLRLNEVLPYTEKVIKQQLSSICGEDGYVYAPDYDRYYLKIRLALANKNNYQDVVDYISRVVPANIVYEIEILYNRYELLEKFTYEELEAYTYQQLREEEL